MLESIITVLGGMIGGGGLVGLLTLKQTKASKDLDNAVRLVNEYRELLSEYKTEIDNNRREIEDVKRKYEACREELIEIKAQLTLAQNMYRQADILRCETLNCKHRIPPINKKSLSELSGLSPVTNKHDNHA